MTRSRSGHAAASSAALSTTRFISSMVGTRGQMLRQLRRGDERSRTLLHHSLTRQPFEPGANRGQRPRNRRFRETARVEFAQIRTNVLVLDFVERQPGAETVNQKFCETMQLAFVSAHGVGLALRSCASIGRNSSTATRDSGSLSLCDRAHGRHPLRTRMMLAMHSLQPSQRQVRVDLRSGDVSVTQ